MAGTKRTAEPTEGTRRSTRSGGTDQPAAPAKKVAAPKKAPAAKKAAAVKEPEVEAEPEPEPEKVEDEAEKEPASKKAKSSVTAVGEVVDDVKLHNGQYDATRTRRTALTRVVRLQRTARRSHSRTCTRRAGACRRRAVRSPADWSSRDSLVLFSYPKASTPARQPHYFP